MAVGTAVDAGIIDGETAEKVAAQWKISREDQDAFAVASHQKACAAIEAGHFKAEISPYLVKAHVPNLKTGEVTIKEYLADTDEGPRPDSSLEKLAKLKPVFGVRNGDATMTAGNSTPLTDGASVALLASEYPEYYSIASYGTPSSYYSDRQITGIGTVCGMAFDWVSTMIAVGQQGEISRSTNSGTTFAAISSPVAVKLGNPIHFDGRWFIPYDNGTLVSTDGGASFKSTATQHGIW